MAGLSRRHSLRRRLLVATLLVSAAAIVVFGTPLALVVARFERERVVLRLERAASQLLAQVPDEQLTGGNAPLPRPLTHVLGGRPTFVGVYGADGRCLSGVGPARSTLAARAASAAREVSGHESGQVVVVEPLRSDRPGTAVVRVAVSGAAVTEEVRESLGWMAALAASVLGLAAIVSLALARRLTRPLEALAARAQQLGAGDFAVRSQRSDTAEIDAVGGALDVTADRLRAVMERERAFTANASHQMRSPLTALRLVLETALLAPDSRVDDVCTEALADVDRLETTVRHLLAVARDADPPASRLHLHDLLREAESRWQAPFRRAGRRLDVHVPEDECLVRGSATGLSHVLDVLLENALEHGQGVVSLGGDVRPGHAVVTVSDEGPGVGAAGEDIFRRRHDASAGHGIGLALARSLVEADNGRLELTHPGPRPVFTLTMPIVSSDEMVDVASEGSFR